MPRLATAGLVAEGSLGRDRGTIGRGATGVGVFLGAGLGLEGVWGLLATPTGVLTGLGAAPPAGGSYCLRGVARRSMVFWRSARLRRTLTSALLERFLLAGDTEPRRKNYR